MTTVVVLSTYNGEKFILEQLSSLLFQTRQPNKVLISDDCSSDCTVEIVKDFIHKNHLNTWEIIENKENIGWKDNFRKLILSVSEDIIFTCDQDDIWNPTKIEEMTNIMENCEDINLLACDYTPQYDDDTRRISRAIIKTMNSSGRIEQVTFDEKFMDTIRPGCTYAIKNSFCQEIAGEWDKRIPHDAYLWRCALAQETAYIYHKSLIIWRRYDGSGSNPQSKANAYKSKGNGLLNLYISANESHLLCMECINRLIENNRIVCNENKLRIIRDRISFETKQIEEFRRKNLIGILMCDFKYWRYLRSKKSIMAHAIACIRN